MTIQLNGSPCHLASGTTIADAVARLTATSDGIAVARNGEIVRRHDWSSIALNDGDTIEVVTARQGG